MISRILVVLATFDVVAVVSSSCPVAFVVAVVAVASSSCPVAFVVGKGYR